MEELPELTLKISDRAAERMEMLGGEFFVRTGGVNLPGVPKNLPLSIANVGRPKDLTGYSKLEQGGITVWVSEEDAFVGNEVIIDLYAFGYVVMPLCVSTIMLSYCAGGCGSCHADCGSRSEEASDGDF